MRYDYYHILKTLEDSGEICAARLANKLQMNQMALYSVLRRLEKQLRVKRVKMGKGSVGTTWAVHAEADNYKPTSGKCIEIQIKPDPAAEWLIPSRPHWEKRSIPVVRSIGLGVRQSTY